MVRFGSFRSIRRFFFSIVVLVEIGRWDESDKIRIAVLKLTGAAKLFYNGVPSFTHNR
jgi:hypothetical protein